MSGVFVSPQDVLDELEDKRYDLVLTWREEHLELMPFSVADVLYLLRCERVGLHKDLHSGTALVPFMSPQERHGLQEALGWMEHWIHALEVLGITDDRTPVFRALRRFIALRSARVPVSVSENCRGEPRGVG